ncbi:hypothetical protein SO694_000611115 [Aureococcus anophagefferens]|uniref:CCR4-NOT transcription complex subunit 10 n=1 Tax=Aureococcus anophagefferens TaxID=44056 RepID=A0ABR1FRC3_AURAN
MSELAGASEERKDEVKEDGAATTTAADAAARDARHGAANEAEERAIAAMKAGDFAEGLRHLCDARDAVGDEAPVSDEDVAARAALDANSGACCAALGSYGIARLHLARSLKLASGGARAAPAHLNMGLAALRDGSPETAHRHLLHASLYFGDRPRVWLRLAECCAAMRTKERAATNATPLARRGPFSARGGRVRGDAARAGRRPKSRADGLGMGLVRASLFARHALRLERDGRPSTRRRPRREHFLPRGRGDRAGDAGESGGDAGERGDGGGDSGGDAGDSGDAGGAPRRRRGPLRVAVALEWADAFLAWPRHTAAATEQRRDLARLYATEARGVLGYRRCERDGVATPGRAGGALRPCDALNCAAIVLSHDKGDDDAALAKAIEAVDADPRNRPAVATLVWLLLRQDRGDDAADVLARCPAEQF